MTDINIPEKLIKGEGEGYQIDKYPEPEFTFAERLFMALTGGWNHEQD